jgi:hypothetical protein
MRNLSRVLVFASFSVIPCAAKTEDAPLLSAGRYEVISRLELPYAESSGVTKESSICISTGSGGPHGLTVLSENNPLAKCPASNQRQDGAQLTFDIICPGGNAATASAKYQLGPQSFEGRIEMKMGGKNMTMMEAQSGHRVGSCSAATNSGS